MKKPLSDKKSALQLASVSREAVLHNQVYQVLFEAGEVTGEYGQDVACNLAREVISKMWECFPDGNPEIEIIEDCIERTLMSSQYHITAKTFILARDRGNRLPEIATQAEVHRVNQYISRTDWEVKENSNMSYSLQGLNHYLSGALSQTYWLNSVYNTHIRNAHESGDFHLHDLTQLSVYCVGWDLADLLREGFCGVSGKIEANPPKHLRTALGQIVNFFYTLQGEAAGAQAFSNFDTLLAPFIRFDGLAFEQVKQALQEFVFNINVPTRVGFQTPFTNITLDLFCPKHLAEESVIVGGRIMENKYNDFQPEMDIFNRALFEVMTEGDARGRIMTFPIPTINLTKDFDWDNQNLDGLWEMTGKYGIPYFSNFINSDMNPEDTRSMCCRLRIDNTKLGKRGGGLFGANPLTGSVGVVTINLPRIGFLAKSKAEFLLRLSNLMELASESLEIKRGLLEKLTTSNLYPYTTFYLKDVKKRFGKYWRNHFSTIGLVGMNEACLNFLEEDITTTHGKEFALEVLDFMRNKIMEFQRETGNLYNLEATPAEGTSFRLARKDKARFRDKILAANENEQKRDSDVPFYTNSIHVPVNYTEDLFAVLDHQDDLQTKFTGGTVVHLFLGERVSDKNIVKTLVKTVAQNYKLPYYSLTPTFSVCQDHGYLSGEQVMCPHCNKQTEIYSRIVGYIRPVQQWNDGKQAEFKLRSNLRFDRACGFRSQLDNSRVV
ncbi:MAG: ribonucleoside triphosphate reductase [Puniceicoccales bacterium]|jgi:ribonucleoside-triphosphate reductase|nr:ribonucleoside triphosphate reductase [Puniceicoccales bacterium]